MFHSLIVRSLDAVARYLHGQQRPGHVDQAARGVSAARVVHTHGPALPVTHLLSRLMRHLSTCELWALSVLHTWYSDL